jgi:hypothetical protein
LIFFSLKMRYSTKTLENILRESPNLILKDKRWKGCNPFEIALIMGNKNIFEIFRNETDEMALKILLKQQETAYAWGDSIKFAASRGYKDCILALRRWKRIIEKMKSDCLQDLDDGLMNWLQHIHEMFHPRVESNNVESFMALARIAPTSALKVALNQDLVSPEFKEAIKIIIKQREVSQNVSQNARSLPQYNMYRSEELNYPQPKK